MSSSDIRYPLSKALEAAEFVKRALAPACVRIETAGSTRRGKTAVHDVDMVVWPEIQMIEVEQQELFAPSEAKPSPAELLDTLIRLGWIDYAISHYPRIIRIEASASDLKIPIELYLTEPDGSNFGALWQMRTGDERFNILLAMRAQKLNLKYQAGHGVYRGQTRVDDGTEDGIFAALGMAPVPVEKRDGAAQLFQFSKKGE